MSCAPFRNPLDNALSYLYTNKAIDADMNITSKTIDFYLNILNKQANGTLFTVVNNKLVPNTELFDSLKEEYVEPDLEVENETVSEYKVVDTMKMDSKLYREAAVPLPSNLKGEDREYIENLYKEGLLQLDCL